MVAMEGGGTLSEVYQSARKLLLRARDGIERLERLECSVSGGLGLDSPELSFDVKKDISQIHSLCADMDRLWRSIAAKSQRDLWKRKVEQVAEEADSLKDSLDKYSMRNQKRMLEAKERAELLGRAVCKLFLSLFLCFLTILLVYHIMFFLGNGAYFSL
ncbi:hypothetical protein DITRI_Ditri06bG0123500 [Diplodiscus trichospermus]